MSVEELEKMTDDELRKYCEPYSKVVRSASTVEEKEDTVVDLDEQRQSRADNKKRSKEDWIKMASQLAQEQGISLELPLPKGLK